MTIYICETIYWHDLQWILYMYNYALMIWLCIYWHDITRNVICMSTWLYIFVKLFIGTTLYGYLLAWQFWNVYLYVYMLLAWHLENIYWHYNSEIVFVWLSDYINLWYYLLAWHLEDIYCHYNMRLFIGMTSQLIVWYHCLYWELHMIYWDDLLTQYHLTGLTE